MPSYCLKCEIPEEYRDKVFVSWYSRGMLGCEEEGISGGIRFKVYFKERQAADEAVRDLSGTLLISPAEVLTIEDRDWNARWRETMKPARLARSFWVSPVWLPPSRLHKGDHWIKIEPKMAFGTGHHETTRLAAQALILNRKKVKNARILDIGTGSGILCFTADILGSSYCTGVEIDPVCRENLVENRLSNQVNGRIHFIIGTVNCLTGGRHFDIVTMNMLMTESLPQLNPVSRFLDSGGIMIWSGILIEEKNQAVKAAINNGFKLDREKTEHEWWCGVFKLTEKNTHTDRHTGELY